MPGLSDLMRADGGAMYYDDAFRNVLEDHLTYLRGAPTTQHLNVAPGDAYRFEYDLYGFLSKFAVPAQLHWVVLRLNKFTSPEEFGPDCQTVLVPDAGAVSQILQSHKAARRIT